ncbi:tyrosine-type recombinase/integrase [Lysobacter sp. FW306-1B-D06B]|uniref:tyrosine-type recombinase/integrase n=1 Tax=Lysobacter sp. FW306-1B-D06B TaxID=3140250 RepID=UPI0031408BC1
MNSIARSSLDFLHGLSLHASIEGFLGPNGQILAEQRQMKRRTPSGRIVSISYWHHSSLPTPDPKVRRLPISSSAIDQLRGTVISIARKRLDSPKLRSTSRYQVLHTRARNLLIVDLLEATGARIGEIALIKISDVRKAERMEYPLLRVPTLKGGRERRVPILHAELRLIREYVDFYRAPLLRSRAAKIGEHDYLLVSRFGTPILAATLSNVFGAIRRDSGISEQACAHMFRHRFITKLFVRLIQEHNFKNQDDFRRRLLDTESFKLKVMEWTGHRSLLSLNHYIHLAFEEIAGFTETTDAVTASKVVQTVRSKVQLELAALAGGAEASKEALNRISRLLEAADRDLAKLS